MPAARSAGLDIPADPFRERASLPFRKRARLLGGEFLFECGSAELQRLVDWAYKGLPGHTLREPIPHFRVRLVSLPRKQRQIAPPRIETLAGPGLLCGTTSSSDFAIVSADQRSALVVVSRNLLQFPYHARYELLEFAVFTLAGRAQGLIPLHAACVGLNGRGLLLVGDSGAGKSTASLHCLLRGLDFVSEDSTFVAPQAMLVTGVANFLHIRCDSLHSVPVASAATIARSSVIRRRSGVEKFEIDLRRKLPGARAPLASGPLKLGSVVFVSAESASGSRLLTPLRPRDAVARLQASQPYAASQPGWGMFKRRVAAIGAFELRRGRHPAEAADALEGLLNSAARR